MLTNEELFALQMAKASSEGKLVIFSTPTSSKDIYLEQAYTKALVANRSLPDDVLYELDRRS